MNRLKLILWILISSHVVFASTQNSCDSYISDSKTLAETKKLMAEAKYSYDRGKFGSTLKKLKIILHQNPHDLPALSLLAKTYMTLNQLDSALKYQKLILSLEKNYREASYFSMAQILIARGDHKEAQKYLQAVLSQSPLQPTTLGLLAESLLLQGKFEDAYYPIQKKGSINRRDPYYLLLEAQFHELQKDFYKALEFANRILDLPEAKPRPANAPKAYRMALLLKAKILSQVPGKELQAWEFISDYEDVTDLSFSWIELLKAEILFRLDRYENSAELLSRIAFKSSSRINLIALGQLLKIENTGFKINFSENARSIITQLSRTQIETAIKISKNPNWSIHNPTDNGLSQEEALATDFWFGVRNLPIKTGY